MRGVRRGIRPGCGAGAGGSEGRRAAATGSPPSGTAARSAAPRVAEWDGQEPPVLPRCARRPPPIVPGRRPAARRLGRPGRCLPCPPPYPPAGRGVALTGRSATGRATGGPRCPSGGRAAPRPPVAGPGPVPGPVRGSAAARGPRPRPVGRATAGTPCRRYRASCVTHPAIALTAPSTAINTCTRSGSSCLRRPGPCFPIATSFLNGPAGTTPGPHIAATRHRYLTPRSQGPSIGRTLANRGKCSPGTCERGLLTWAFAVPWLCRSHLSCAAILRV